MLSNKYDRRGAEDRAARRRAQAVASQPRRPPFKLADEQGIAGLSDEVSASQFNDPGVTWMFSNLCRLLRDKLHLEAPKWTPQIDTTLKEPRATVLIPGARVRYLAEIAEAGRGINRRIEKQSEIANRAQTLWEALHELGDAKLPKQLAAL